MGRMSPIAKWIGGATLAVLGVLGALLFAGRTLEAASNDPEQWLAEDDLLAHAEAKPVAPTPPALAPVAEPSSSPLVIKRILPIDGPIRYGEWHWDEEGVPGGPLVVTVDLQARVISVFRGGYEIGAAAVMLGTDQHPTPTGVFPILTKERHNVSEKYDNAPMPWTLRLTHDGVAIHGGNEVERGFASHGCIGTPDGFVSKLFAIAKPGDKVIITDGKKASIGAPLI
jgi:hypothetical protein